MKKVGIIGGAGPLASALFYESLVHESYIQGRPVPEIVLINYPFTRGLSKEEGSKNKQTLKEELGFCLEFLTKCKAEIGILACNTLHLILREMAKGPVFFQHLPELVLEEAMGRGHQRLLVLGTATTCHANLYHAPGVSIMYPEELDQKIIAGIIDRVLEGKIVKEDAHRLGKIIHKITNLSSIDGVVLGCTELPVLHHHFPIHSTKPIYDSIKIPAKILVRLI